MIVPVIARVPTDKQRRAHLRHGGTYARARVPGLWRPLMQFPAGMYPLGHEHDHLTEEQLREAHRNARS